MYLKVGNENCSYLQSLFLISYRRHLIYLVIPFTNIRFHNVILMTSIHTETSQTSKQSFCQKKYKKKSYLYESKKTRDRILLLKRLSLKSIMFHSGIKLNLELKIRLRPMCWSQVFGMTFDESHHNKPKSVRRALLIYL